MAVMVRAAFIASLSVVASGARVLRKNRVRSSAGTAYAAMGNGRLDVWDNYTALQGPPSSSVSLQGKATWAVEIPGGLALCDETRNFLVFVERSGDRYAVTGEVHLGPLSAPVGAKFFEGKIWVAMFGAGGSSGVVKVDPTTRQIESSFPFPETQGEGRLHVHNVYNFAWNGNDEIFVAVLGVPWAANGAIPGRGLSLLNQAGSGKFEYTTSERLMVRSAVQESETVFYALTQERWGQRQKLVRLEKVGDQLRVVSVALLPATSGGDGGADVILGPEPGTVFCTDRVGWAPSKLHYYKYADGAFQLLRTREIRGKPRYSTVLPNGDMVVCDQTNAELTVFEGLASDPTGDVPTRTVPTVADVSFFIPFEAAPPTPPPTTEAPTAPPSPPQGGSGIFCNPSAGQMCPGGIPCPQCGAGACECP